MKKREKKPKSKVRRILEWTGFGIIAALFVFAMVAQIDAMVHKDENLGQQLRFGVGSFVVETNSMEPDYMVDSAIVTYKKSPEEIYKQHNENPDQPIDLTFSYQFYPSFKPKDSTLTNQTNDHAIPRELNGHPMTHRLREILVDNSQPVGQGHYIFVVAGINPDSTWALNQYQVFDERYLLGVVVLNSNALGQIFKFIASPWGLFGLLLIPAFYLVISSMIDIFRVLKEPEEAAASSGGSGTVSSIDEKDRERLKQEMLLQMLDEKRKAKQAQNAVENKAESPEKPAETAPKEEKSETLSGYSDEQKQALRQQMLAQIMAERASGKEAPKKEEPAKESKPEKKEEKGSLEGYSDEQKQALRQQMLAQIMAEKKAAKEKKEVKEDKDDGQA